MKPKLTPREIERAVDNMIIYGGSFVKDLAKLYIKADSTNKNNLLRSFELYFVDYSKK